MFKGPQGINIRMRALLKAKFRAVILPKATPKLGITHPPRRSPSLVEVAYSSAWEVKPTLFIAGCGMTVPDQVECWMNEEPRGEQ